MKFRSKHSTKSHSAEVVRGERSHCGEASHESLAAGLESELPTAGRLAGIDYGTVRIGLATCDPSQQWVTPYDTYQTRNAKLDAEFFERLATREELSGWVIGLPIHCDGKESQKSAEVRDFALWLGRISGLPYAFYDERFSTREARRLLAGSGLGTKQKKQRLDRLAAHLILSHYLEFRRNQLQSGLSTPDPNQALED